MSRSAVVFSPHFDDETLGCGGTIIKKKTKTRSPQEFLKSSKNSLVSVFRLLKELRYHVYIGDVLGPNGPHWISIDHK